MATITIMDPVTRIEGHMKVKVKIDQVGGQNKVVNAWCTGTLFRGFETLLEGRDPWDAPVITSRICGVCPVSHGLASVMALDEAAGSKPPGDARRLRNLVLASNFVQSHILHFYLLAAFDYVKGPESAPWTPAWNVDMRGGLDDIGSHLGLAIEARTRAHEMGAVFGGKMPIPHTYIPGGFTAVPTADGIAKFREHLNWLDDFVQDTYIPDVELLASIYDDYLSVGTQPGNLLAFGVFDLDGTGSRKLFRRGRVLAGEANNVRDVWPKSIAESVTYSWYDESTTDLNPTDGATTPLYPKEKAYSWLKAPRYRDIPYEVGPLARMWVNGDYRDGVSVIDRHLARAYETAKIIGAMHNWLDRLNLGGDVYDSNATPGTASGMGLTEAPRGALGHWVQIDGGKISHYQVVTPTCWNASPRDSNRKKGPMEKALMGTQVEDPDRPVEVLRVIHSFDPCLSCAVHVMRPDGKPVVIRAGQRV